MFTFRGALRWFFGLAGLALGVAAAIAVFLARAMIAPARQHLKTTPQSRGLLFEDVQFPAQDGLRVSGWFVQAQPDAENATGTIILMHGWQWNRHGYDEENLMANVSGSKSVDLLPLIEALSTAGFNVLTIDLRNHGQSATAHPMTYGQSEAKDLLGALAYLESRPDIGEGRLGVLGFSIGANAALFALPQTNKVGAAVLVQPMTPALFMRRLSTNLFSVFGSLIDVLARTAYQLAGGPRVGGIVPAFAASGIGDVPVLYLQGTGDEWGSVEDVSVMAEMTPDTRQLLFVNTEHRFDGHRYVVNRPSLAVDFFTKNLA